MSRNFQPRSLARTALVTAAAIALGASCEPAQPLYDTLEDHAGLKLELGS